MKQVLLLAATIAVLILPGVVLFVAYPRATATVPVIYVTPQAFDGGADMPRCTLRGA